MDDLEFHLKFLYCIKKKWHNGMHSYKVSQERTGLVTPKHRQEISGTAGINISGSLDKTLFPALIMT